MHRQHLNTNITKHIDPTHQKPFKALIDKMDDTSTLLPPNELQPQSPPHLPSFNKEHVQRRSRAYTTSNENQVDKSSSSVKSAAPPPPLSPNNNNNNKLLLCSL